MAEARGILPHVLSLALYANERFGEAKELARKRNYENFQKVVEENLIKKGARTRFKTGSKGRTADMLSSMTKSWLIKNISGKKKEK